MADNLNIHFPFADLLRSGDLILTAGEGDVAVIARLPDKYLADSRTLWKNLGGADALKAQLHGASGDLTKEETAKRKVLEPLMAALKETAKKAFKGADVKLHDEFQVGINEPHDTASVLRRAGIMLASAQNTANAAALKLKAWGDADTKKLETAIGAFRTTDTVHETAKLDAGDATGKRNRDANDLYDQLQTIQNAASLEYPDTDSSNAPKRAAFLLGKFPPHGGNKKKSATADKPQTPDNPPAPPAK
jgi:hypothetical protein